MNTFKYYTSIHMKIIAHHIRILAHDVSIFAHYIHILTIILGCLQIKYRYLHIV